MNTILIGELIKLRYKLMWARTRTRNGKIALFFAGYLLLVFFLAIFSLGGIGAGIAAVRMGKAQTVAAGVLGGLYFQACWPPCCWASASARSSPTPNCGGIRCGRSTGGLRGTSWESWTLSGSW